MAKLQCTVFGIQLFSNVGIFGLGLLRKKLGSASLKISMFMNSVECFFHYLEQ